MQASIRPHNVVCLLVLWSLLACTAGDQPVHKATRASEELPALRRVAFAPSEDAPPSNANERFALGADGSVGMAISMAGDEQLGIFDSLGTLRVRMGRSGEGPGEIRVPIPAALLPNEFLVADMAQARLVSFDPSNGKSLRTITLTTPILIAANRGKRFLVSSPTPTGMLLPGWFSLDQDQATVAVEPTDSFVTRLFPRGPDPRVGPRPTIGAWRGGVIVADGISYTVGLYDSSGTFLRSFTRDLPARLPTSEQIQDFERRARAYRGPDGRATEPSRIAADLERFRSTSLPHFSHVAPILDDDFGRIWIVGMAGDSAFADVFTPSGHIGTIPLSCPGFVGRWALNGSWLALVCSAPGSATRNAELQLYRLVEPVP